jgi:transketolase
VAEETAPREIYGKTLVELGRENKNIVVLDADVAPSTMTSFFQKAYPERFYEVGIAEANMIGLACGLAANGKIPFASTFAVFATSRCYDQLRVSVALAQLNVKVVATHSGLTVGEDGASHQSLEDLALVCALPGFKVIIPADGIETAQVIRAVAALDGPCYVRLPRGKVPVIYDNSYKFEIGKASVLRPGKDATIMAIGTMVAPALEAAAALAKENINCRVLNMSSLKPIDEAAVITAGKETGAIVTAEEHQEHGGLGGTVARVLSTKYPCPLELVAVKDKFGMSGKPAELLKRYGLTAEEIAKAVKRAIQRKR